MKTLRTLLLPVFVASCLSGCSTFISRSQEAINDLGSKASLQDLEFLVHKSGPVWACVKAPGGHCDLKGVRDAADGKLPAGAKAEFIHRLVAAKNNPAADSGGVPVREVSLKAATALTNPTATKLEMLFEHAAGLRDSTEALPTISRSELSAYASAIHEATSLDSWGTLKADIERRPNRNTADAAAAESTIRQLTLIEAYLSAYFSNGRFVSLDIDATNITSSAAAQLQAKLHVKEADAKELAGNLLKQLMGETPHTDNKYHLLVKAKEGGFVTRGGAKYTFPGVSLTVDPASSKVVQISKVDFAQVGADVVRVVLEATADEWGQLPADSTSTACTLKKAKQLEKYEQLKCYIEADQQVDATGFAKVNDIANKSETYVATVTGKLIRGVSWLSLNNEALAQLIETAVGVVARKASEKVTWCYLACRGEYEKAKTTARPGDRPIPALSEPTLARIPMIVER